MSSSGMTSGRVHSLLQRLNTFKEINGTRHRPGYREQQAELLTDASNMIQELHTEISGVIAAINDIVYQINNISIGYTREINSPPKLELIEKRQCIEGTSIIHTINDLLKVVDAYRVVLAAHTDDEVFHSESDNTIQGITLSQILEDLKIYVGDGSIGIDGAYDILSKIELIQKL